MTASGNLANSTPIIKPVEKALDLARRGFWVFPCKADKTPCGTVHGYKDASVDAVQIRVMFAAPSAELVGIACPQSHIHVLDIDVKAEAYYQAHKDEVPDTLQVRSRSGGRHFFFNANDPEMTRTTARGGVDVRAGNPASGGYIIAWRDAWEYDRKLMADGFPSGFVAGAHAQAQPTAAAAGIGLGTGTTGQGQGQGANGQARPWPIAERVRWHADQGVLVPDGERDNFLIEAYGHALRAVRDNVAGLEEALAWCGRVNERLVGGADKDFVGKIGRIMAAQGMNLPSGLDVGRFEHVQDGLAIVPFPVGKVAQAQGQFGSIPEVSDPFKDWPETRPAPGLEFTPLSGAGASRAGLMVRPRITDSLVRGELSLLASQPSAGKSALMLLEAAAIVWNRPDLVGDRGPIERAGSVLIVSNEDALDETEKRLAAICQRWGLDRWTGFEGRRVVVVKSRLGVALVGRAVAGQRVDVLEHLREIEAWIEGRRAGGEEICMVGVDTQASALAGLDENAASDMAAAMAILANWTERTWVATRLVHHQVKSAGMDSGDKLLGTRGSSAIIAGVRRQLNLNVVELPAGVPGRWVSLHNSKLSHGDPDSTRPRYFKHQSVRLPVFDEAGQLMDESVVVLEHFADLPTAVGTAQDLEDLIVQIVSEETAAGHEPRVDGRGGRRGVASLGQRLEAEGLSAKDAKSAIEKTRRAGKIIVERSETIPKDRGVPPLVYKIPSASKTASKNPHPKTASKNEGPF